MRILIADRLPKVRFALRVLLDQQPSCEVVGEAGDADGLLSQVQVASPDLVLLDWELLGARGVELLFAMRKAVDRLYVVALSGRPEARRVSLDAGADAFVSKSDPPERLLATIDGCRHKT
jgi:DNA-binding NarL/FixJ family response regulator